LKANSSPQMLILFKKSLSAERDDFSRSISLMKRDVGTRDTIRDIS